MQSIIHAQVSQDAVVGGHNWSKRKEQTRRLAVYCGEDSALPRMATPCAFVVIKMCSVQCERD